MKFCSSLLAAAALLSAAPALTADADTSHIKANAMVKTSDGARVGRIDRIITGTDGAPTAIKIIFKGRFVTIPAESLSVSGDGLVTTLSRSDVNRL